MSYRIKIFQKMDGFLQRPRIAALLDDVVKHPLVTVVAGPGYGKTASFVQYIRNTSARVIWMRATRLDQLPSRFWPDFLRALQEEFSGQLVQQLSELGYPNTLHKLDIFLHLFAEELYQGNQVLFVVDDYADIAHSEVRYFFEYLIDASFEGLCLALLSRTEAGLSSIRHHAETHRMVSTYDLRFTPGETKALFQQHGVSFQEAELLEIARQVDGWPLPLYLLATQANCDAAACRDFQDKSAKIINGLLDSEYFSQYNAEVRLLLIKLSLLNGFTMEIARRLFSGPPQELQALFQDNTFIAYDQTTQLLGFQHFYAAFLSQQQYLLSDEEKRQTYSNAGDHYDVAIHPLEAAECYAKCGRYDAILGIIAMYASTRVGMDMGAAQAKYLLSFLQSMPQEFRLSNPLADYLIAYSHLCNMDVDLSWQQLSDLEQRLLPDSSAQAQALLGNVYTLQGGIQMMRNREDFGYYYKKAVEVMPEGTKMKKKTALLVENFHNFSLQDNAPGALERMEKAVHWGMAYFIKAMNGGGSGLQHLYSSEAGYNTFDMEKARLHAHKAIHEGKAHDQFDIVCNAHILLARVALIEGTYPEIAEHIGEVGRVIQDNALNDMLGNLRDTAFGWLYLKMDDLDQIASWITSNGQDAREYLSAGREHIIAANYLLRKQRYSELLALLETMEHLYLARGAWPDRLCVYIMRAIAYYKLQDEPSAVRALYSAYEMSYHNGIVTPFIEASVHMQPLAELARRHPEYEFDHAWLEGAAQKATAHAKRIAALKREHQKQYHTPPAQSPLSSREMEILLELSRGLTREEISQQQYISVNTVKTHIKSIYNKLGALNRADAIRLATLMGILSEQ